MNPNSKTISTNLDDESAEADIPTVAISRSSFKVPASLQAQLEVDEAAPPVAQESFAAVKPEATEAGSDPSAVTLQLPSNGTFYPFRNLSIKPVKGYHQAKFARAAKEKTTRHIVEAITTLLPQGVNAMDLTVPDFYYLLYWLRLNCYTKAQLVHRGVCQNPKHVEEVKAGKKAPASLVTLVTVGKTSLRETELDPAYLDGFEVPADVASELQEAKVELYPLCMKDVVDLEENFDDVKEEGTELEYLSDLASFLRSTSDKPEDASLKSRVMIVEDLSPDALEVIADYRDRVSQYGVEEFLKFNCQECGAGNETAVSISAHSFL